MNVSNWKVDKISWAGKIFNSTSEVVAWYTANNNTSGSYKVVGYDTPEQLKFSTFEVRNKETTRGAVQGASLYEPAGKRWAALLLPTRQAALCVCLHVAVLACARASMPYRRACLGLCMPASSCSQEAQPAPCCKRDIAYPPALHGWSRWCGRCFACLQRA